MTIKIFFVATLASVIFLFFNRTHHEEPNSIGFTEISFTDSTRAYEGKPRNLDVVIWYPVKPATQKLKIAHGIWKIEDAEKDAPLFSQDKKLPLILFSHGYGGEPYGNSWFAEYLASHGYIVASVKHAGNAYGNIIPEISARPWNRPQDICFTLDQLLTHSLFKNAIDENKIGVAGFSQGGVTSLWLAGMQGDLTQESLRKHIETIKDQDWKVIHEQFTQEDIKAANANYKDERIKAVFTLAPGLDFDNWLFTDKEKISQVKIPVEIVVGASDTTVSVAKNASFFAKYIPNSTLTIIPGEVTHWTFMNESTADGKKWASFITVDPQSVNRGEIHKQVGALALNFFNKHLK